MEVDYVTTSILQAIDMEGTSHDANDYGTVARFGLNNLLIYVETPIPPINLNALMIFGAIVKLGNEVPMV
jgi:hypothetical protein